MDETMYSLTLNKEENEALGLGAAHHGSRTKSQFIRFLILEYAKNNKEGKGDE